MDDFGEELDLIGQDLDNLHKLSWPMDGSFIILNLHDNHLQNLHGLPVLRSLKELILSSNRIASCSLPELNKLINLEVLDLSGNFITSLSSIPFLINLRVFSVAYNQITSLYNIDMLPNLEELDIRGNPISHCREVDYLYECTSLKKLTMQNAAIPTAYIFQLFSIVKSLEVIDDRDIEGWRTKEVNSYQVPTPHFDRIKKHYLDKIHGSPGSRSDRSYSKRMSLSTSSGEMTDGHSIPLSPYTSPKRSYPSPAPFVSPPDKYHSPLKSPALFPNIPHAQPDPTQSHASQVLTASPSYDEKQEKGEDIHHLLSPSHATKAAVEVTLPTPQPDLSPSLNTTLNQTPQPTPTSTPSRENCDNKEEANNQEREQAVQPVETNTEQQEDTDVAKEKTEDDREGIRKENITLKRHLSLLKILSKMTEASTPPHATIYALPSTFYQWRILSLQRQSQEKQERYERSAEHALKTEKQLLGRINALMGRLSEKEGRVRELEAEVEKVRGDWGGMQGEVEGLIRERREAQERREELEVQVNALQRELDAAWEKVRVKDEDFGQLQEEFRALQQRCTEAESQNIRLVDEQNHEKQRMLVDRDIWERERADSAKDLAQEREQREACEKELAKLKERGVELSCAYQQLSEEYRSLSVESQAFIERDREQKDTIKMCRKYIEKMQKKIDMLKSEKHELQQQIASNSPSPQPSNPPFSSSPIPPIPCTNCTQLEEECQGILRENANLKSQVASYKSQLISLEKVEVSVREMEEKIFQTTEQMKMKDTIIQDKVRENGELKSKHMQLELHVQSLKREQEILKENCSRAQAEAERCKQEVGKKRVFESKLRSIIGDFIGKYEGEDGVGREDISSVGSASRGLGWGEDDGGDSGVDLLSSLRNITLKHVQEKERWEREQYDKVDCKNPVCQEHRLHLEREVARLERELSECQLSLRSVSSRYDHKVEESARLIEALGGLESKSNELGELILENKARYEKEIEKLKADLKKVKRELKEREDREKELRDVMLKFTNNGK